MNEPVYLGLIAFGVVLMAVVQLGAVIGAVVYGTRLTRRVNQLTEQIEREMKPVVLNLQTVGAEAARASALAAAQVERADRVFADVSRRVEETAAIVQNAVVAPAREGMAVVAGLRAAIGSINEIRKAAARPSRPGRPEEDDPLFIG